MEQCNSDLWPFKQHLGKPESMHMVFSSLDFLCYYAGLRMCCVILLCYEQRRNCTILPAHLMRLQS